MSVLATQLALSCLLLRDLLELRWHFCFWKSFFFFFSRRGIGNKKNVKVFFSLSFFFHVDEFYSYRWCFFSPYFFLHLTLKKGRFFFSIGIEWSFSSKNFIRLIGLNKYLLRKFKTSSGTIECVLHIQKKITQISLL